MNPLEVFHTPWLTGSGIALAHSLWQGAIIGLSLALLLVVIPKRNASLRYCCCQVALFCFLLLPAVTLLTINPESLNATLVVETASIPHVSLASDEENRPESTEYTEVAAVDVDSLNATVSGEQELADPVPVNTKTIPVAAPAFNPSLSAGKHWPDKLTPLLPLLTVAWLAGVLFMTCRLLFGWRKTRLLRRRAFVLPERLEQIAQQMLHSFELAGRAVVLVTTETIQPVAVGLLRPAVLLPRVLIEKLPTTRVEAMMAHELAHIRRYDLWVNLLQRIVETLFFYHPVAWWASERMRSERELCCDDLAAEATGNRSEYANALLDISQYIMNDSPTMSVGILGSRLSLTERIRRTLQMSPETQPNRIWLAGPLSVALAGSILFAAHLQAKAATTNDDPEKTEEVTGSETTIEEDIFATSPDVILTMPETKILETKFDKANIGLANDLKQQQDRMKILEPAIKAGKAVHALRDALFNEDLTELQRVFRPNDKPVTAKQLKQLVSDIGMFEGRHRSNRIWRIAYIAYSEELESGLVICNYYNFSPPPSHETPFQTAHMQIRLVAEVTKDGEAYYVSRLTAVASSDLQNVNSFIENWYFTNLTTQEKTRSRLVIAKFGNIGGRIHGVLSQFSLYSPELNDRDWTLKKLNTVQGGDFSTYGFFKDYEEPQPVSSEPPVPKVEEYIVTIRFPASGIVKRITNSPREVKKGEVLVELENTELILELRAAEVRLKKLQYNLDRLNKIGESMVPEMELIDLKSDVELATIEVEKWKHRLENTYIKSPHDGRVTGCLLTLRGKVEAGDEAINVHVKKPVR